MEEDYFERLTSYIERKDGFDRNRLNDLVTNFFPGLEENPLEPSESKKSPDKVPPDHHPHVTNSAYDRSYDHE